MKCPTHWPAQGCPSHGGCNLGRNLKLCSCFLWRWAERGSPPPARTAVIYATSLTHQRKKSKLIQLRLAANVPPSDLAAHFHAVILRYFAFHQQIRLHCENEKAVLWTFSVTHRRPQLGSCCSARGFCS